ncbi:serine/threonine-protein kinase [Plantactinospora solaniradicis]|uniref:non-specific serine/threonine protein kinase n=1 Tax=Plantactinospora solaniradicis TaxID=1723736 RepID=A0ABW1JYR5_9ACTN
MDRVLGGRYRLVREVAYGAIGIVWRGVDLCDGQPVAIKMLRPEAAVRPDLVAGFQAETDVVAGLDHPCLVRPRDVLGQGRERALVMELIEGEDLRRRLRRTGPVPPAIAAEVAAQLAGALAYLHRRGIMHGDVKPGNILVPADGGLVRLVDFGAARRIGADPGWPTTQATPEYVAPEVIVGGPVTPASDVYALGIVLFELVSGRSPYRGGLPDQVLDRHRNCQPVPPPGLPPLVWQFVEDCLATDPARRPDAERAAARLRGMEPALDGITALPRPAADQVTWWPRRAGAATGIARVGRPGHGPTHAAPVPPAPASPERTAGAADAASVAARRQWSGSAETDPAEPSAVADPLGGDLLAVAGPAGGDLRAVVGPAGAGGYRRGRPEERDGAGRRRRWTAMPLHTVFRSVRRLGCLLRKPWTAESVVSGGRGGPARSFRQSATYPLKVY